MSKLAKWLPFMFKRKARDKQEAETPPPTGPSTAALAPTAQMGHMSQMLDSMLSDRFWRNPWGMFEEMDRFFGDFAPRTYHPNVDIIDEGKHIRVTAELPGLDRDDVEITVQEGLLILRGEKHSKTELEEQGCYRVERYFGHFQRAIPLPSDVDTDGAEAKFDRGILTIRLPKTGDAGSARRIAIK
jgi:HSP20 family protein